MAFKLIQAAQALMARRERPPPGRLAGAGAVFQAGKLVERPDKSHQPEAAQRV